MIVAALAAALRCCGFEVNLFKVMLMAFKTLLMHFDVVVDGGAVDVNGLGEVRLDIPRRGVARVLLRAAVDVVADDGLGERDVDAAGAQDAVQGGLAHRLCEAVGDVIRAAHEADVADVSHSE